VGVGDDGHRLLAQRRQDVAIAGIARRRQSHPGAHVEQGEERQYEAGGGAGGYNHALRFHADAVPLGVVAGDPLAQGRQTEGDGISQRLALQRLRHAGQCRPRRRGAGLAHLHVDDAVPLGLALGGGLHHIHHDERRDGAAPRGLEAGRRSADLGSRRVHRVIYPPARLRLFTTEP
jgi:hypothetical protein